MADALVLPYAKDGMIVESTIRSLADFEYIGLPLINPPVNALAQAAARGARGDPASPSQMSTFALCRSPTASCV